MPHATAQIGGAGGVVALNERGTNGDAPSLPFMIEIDDSRLTDEHRDLVERWAAILEISVPELLGRILVIAIEGEIYCEKLPPD